MHPTGNTQHATYIVQHAAGKEELSRVRDVQRAHATGKRATCNMQPQDPWSMHHACMQAWGYEVPCFGCIVACCPLHATRSVQHATSGFVEHETCNMRPSKTRHNDNSMLTARNMQPHYATSKMQDARCKMKPTKCSSEMQPAARDMQHATRDMQTCNTQPATRDLQHATCNTRHAACNTRHAACNNGLRG
jgi:hypothetical protein